ncbi:HAD-IIA family hydrolase [Halomicroarcula sp. S1AR25-4]|uniref:HAD-IIA family hydrolase n=1 Tax=Haloarcula sp. S1AR25-4 TaxID=2950538 RepID=UPI002876A99A|nr:HAD-IIA family hydrolase [Halomicroarcula sp. S1AR25-4]MDS0276877.1 HAD-IIA family hydrolase [Halomicroarcula sp. S1AR25-4]
MTVRGVIVDLDGTVYHGDRLLPGAAAAIDRLRERGLSLCFFSNNPLHDGTEYVERLSELGVDARPGEACSSAVVTREYLDANHAGDGVFVVGAPSLRDRVRTTRAKLVSDPRAADALLASWTDEFHYRDMVDALRALDDETVFLGTDPDPTFPDEDGNPTPGSGAIIRAISGVVERDPDLVLGKPSDVAVEAALERVGCSAEECLVVGDRLDTDVAMGERAGMQTALVRSGVSDDADVERSEVTPDHVVDSLADVDGVLDAIR